MNTRMITLTVASMAVLGLAACNSPESAEPATDAMSAEGAMAPAAATTDPMVGGAAMSPDDTIVANAPRPRNLSTLVSAVQAADLVETLIGAGPFTVFAPDQRRVREGPRRHA